MANIDDIHPNAFQELCESIKQGNWAPEVSEGVIQNDTYYVRCGDQKIWVANGRYNLSYSRDSNFTTYYFGFMQSFTLWRLLRPLYKAGEEKRLKNNIEIFQRNIGKREAHNHD